MEVIYDIFSIDQIENINSIINEIEIPNVPFDQNRGTGLCFNLGRVQINNIAIQMPQSVKDKIYELVGPDLAIDHALYVEYNSKYGKPNLPPHLDGDTNDLILNYQLDSNTQWDIGIDLNTYSLKNNSAIIFNGNTNIHWRVHKEFKKQEYVKMIFIRLFSTVKKSDYRDLTNDPNHEIFKEVVKFRDSLVN